MYYAQKLATLKAQKSVYEKKIPELQSTKDKQEEIKNQAYDQLIKLKAKRYCGSSDGGRSADCRIAEKFRSIQ